MVDPEYVERVLSECGGSLTRFRREWVRRSRGGPGWYEQWPEVGSVLEELLRRRRASGSVY